jgi:hypothetical protein
MHETLMSVNQRLDAILECRSAVIIRSGDRGNAVEADEALVPSGKYVSKRYGKNGRVDMFFHVKSQDDLSKMLQSEDGYVYINDGPVPRLLCEDFPVGIDRQALLLAAVSFFYKDLRDVEQAFDLPGTECCLKAIDECACTVLMIFEFEPFGSNLSLNLLAKKQFETPDLLAPIKEQILGFSPSAEDISCDKISQYAAKIVNGIEDIVLVMMDVFEKRLSSREGYSLQRNARMRLRDTKYLQLVRDSGGVPFIWNHASGLPDEDISLCEKIADDPSAPTAIDDLMRESIDYYFPGQTEIRHLIDEDNSPMQQCWGSTDGDGNGWFRFRVFEVSKIGETYTLSLYGVCRAQEMSERRLAQVVKKILSDQLMADLSANKYAETAYEAMCALQNARGYGRKFDFNTADVVRIFVDDQSRLEVADAYVRAVHRGEGSIHSCAGDVGEPFDICMQVKSRNVTPDEVMKASIPHFWPWMRNVNYAFAGDHDTIFKAENAKGDVILFIFELHRNRALGEFSIQLVQSIALGRFSLSE